MKLALSITVEKKSDGTFGVVSPSLLNGKPTTYNFCSTEAIGAHLGARPRNLVHCGIKPRVSI